MIWNDYDGVEEEEGSIFWNQSVTYSSEANHSVQNIKAAATRR